MTNPTQVLRSTSAGNRPTGRQPGEPFVNYPDLQFGVVDIAGTAVDLIAVRFFSATAHYNIGDHVLQGGVLYRAIASTGPGAFAPASWTRGITLADATATYLPLAGGTMTGLLLLSGDPAAALGAATKQMVDGKVSKAGDVMSDKLIISHGVAGRAHLLLYTPIGTPEGALPILDLQNDIVPTVNNGTPGVIRFWAKDSAGAVPSNAPIIQFIGIQSNIAPGAVSAKLFVSTVNNGVNANRLVIGGGVFTPSVADMGNDTINAQVYYANGIQLAPPGAIVLFAGPFANIPAGWFACNGANQNRAANPKLFAALGTAWGAGDGSTTFGLPDLRGRVPAGVDDMGGTQGAAGRIHVATWVGGLNVVTLGGIGGEELHTPVGQEQFVHNHGHNHVPTNGGTFRTNIGGGANYLVSSTTLNSGSSMDQDATSNSGGAANQAHNTLPPTLLVNYIIRGG